MKQNNLGYIYVVLAAFFFALIAIIGKCAFNTGMKVYDLLIMQNAVSVVGLFGYLWITDKKSIFLTKTQLKNVVIQGIFGSTAATVCFYLAVDKMNAGIAAMLAFTNPVFVTLFFVMTGIRKITWVNNLAVILALIGSALVINVFNLNLAKTPLIGLAYGIICSITYAFYTVFADLRLKDIKPEVIPLYTSAIMLVISSIIDPGFFRFDMTFTPQMIWYVFELAVISGILPTVFLYKGILLIGAEKVAIIATAELPITLILAFLVLKETMVFSQVTGVVLIVGAIFVLQHEAVILQGLKFGKKDKITARELKPSVYGANTAAVLPCLSELPCQDAAVDADYTE